MNLSYKGLTKLPNNLPKEIIGWFSCSHNLLTTLEGGPKKVEGGFDCSYNMLTSLEKGPKKVGTSFHCYYNPNLSLKEILKFMSKCYIGGDILTDYGNLTEYKNRVLSDREILKIMLRFK
jgi:hypothetical protein